MSGPSVTENDFTERLGVIAVDSAVTAARCVWRETPLRDVGIDGQIEHVRSGVATGRIVAVQIKSGESYFARRRDGAVPFIVAQKHRRYWEAFPLPVIVILHHPDEGLTVWGDAQSALRRGESALAIPERSVLNTAGIHAALAIPGPLPASEIDLDELILEMAQTRTADAGCDMSFLDLFCHGLTDLAFCVYFHMDVVSEVIDYHAVRNGLDGYGIGTDGYEFIDRYVAFLVAQNLARVDFDNWRETAEERQMTGRFISPLTRRGRELVRRLGELDHETLGPSDDHYAAVVQERSVEMVMLGFDARARRIDALSDALIGRAR